MKTERIDGTDYIVGSVEHSTARRLMKARNDAIFVQASSAELRRDERRISISPLGERLDANQTAFLARDLLFIRRQIELTIYARLRAAEFIPVSTEVPRGAQSYATRRADYTGEAKISHMLAGDHPRVDTKVSEDLAKLVNITASYGYSLQDMEYAAFAGIQLSRDKAMACADVIARGLDKVGRIGDAATGLTGFFNDTNVPTVTLTNGEWLTATAAEILADLAQIEQAVISQSKDTFRPDVLVLPTAYHGRLTTLEKSSGSDLTVAEFFLRNARMIKRIEGWQDLDDATGADVGVADPPQAILYARSIDVLRWEVPIMYEEQPPEVRNFEWVINARARCGGVDVRRPLSMVYVENLD